MLAWRNTLRFRMILFSDDGTTANPENCYDLVIQRRFVYLRKRWLTDESGGSRIMGQQTIAALTEKESVQYEFFLDREAGTLGLYVDGVQQAVWTDNAPERNAFGKWLHFISEDFFPLKVSQIRLSPWIGELPAEGAEVDQPQQANNDGQQGVRLLDSSWTAGTIKGIENQALHLQTAAGDVQVPLAQIRSIDFARADYEEPKRKKGDIRAWTPEGDRLTFRLDSMDEKTLKGHSEMYGDAEFNLNAFTRLEFNIYHEEFEKLRGAAPAPLE
jgi:hypothetical protein